MVTLVIILFLPLVASSCKESESNCLVCYGDECYITSDCVKSNCLECNAETQHCIACKPGFFEYQGDCLDCSQFDSCDQNRCSAYGCYTCKQGTYEKMQQVLGKSAINCVSCREMIEDCLECSSSSKNATCKVCSAGHALAKYNNSTFCLKCPEFNSCPFCKLDSKHMMDVCYYCYTEKYLKRLSGECNYIPSTQPTEMRCETANCLSCSVDAEAQSVRCDSCAKGFILGIDRECYSNCNLDEYFLERECLSCTDKFALCNKCNHHFCLECTENAFPDKNQEYNVCSCKAAYLNMFGSCKSVFYLVLPISFALGLIGVGLIIGCRKQRRIVFTEDSLPEIKRYLPETVPAEGMGILLKTFIAMCSNCKREPAAYKKARCECYYCAWCFYMVYLKGICLKCPVGRQNDSRSEVSENMLMLKENKFGFEMCPICLISKVKTKLSCGNNHKLCLECLIRLVTDKKIRCPICRKIFKPFNCKML